MPNIHLKVQDGKCVTHLSVHGDPLFRGDFYCFWSFVCIYLTLADRQTTELLRLWLKLPQKTHRSCTKSSWESSTFPSALSNCLGLGSIIKGHFFALNFFFFFFLTKLACFTENICGLRSTNKVGGVGKNRERSQNREKSKRKKLSQK